MAAGSGEQLETVFECMKNDRLRTIVLVGKPGVGKTWMARKLSDRAIREGLFDLNLWLPLNRHYDSITLCKSIAHQLSLLPVSDEWKFEESSENFNENDINHEQKKEYLRAKTLEALEQKRFLIILDAEGSQMTSHDILRELKNLQLLDGKESYKFLITSTQHRDDRGPEGETKTINVECLSENESLNLLQKLVDTKVYKLSRIKDLAKYFLGKRQRFPFEVTIMAKVLNHFGQNESGICHLESIKENNVEGCNVLQLLTYGYELFPRNILIDFCWIGNHFLRKRGSFYFGELISYWILEAYLDNNCSIEDAYKKGHTILMELVDCGLLKQLESGHVGMTEAKYDLDDFDYCKFVQTTQLGLASVFDGELGRVVQAKGMIKTSGAGEIRKKISTLLLDLDCLDSEVPSDFFHCGKELEVLAIFNPGLQPFPLPLFEMDKLHLLVLRGCNLLVSIEQFLKFENPICSENSAPLCVFQKLTVLEISGPSALKHIPDKLFNHTPHLRSINLSFLEIASLPLSLYDLKGLVWLILRGCSDLQEVRSLKMLDKLEVLDLSGARSLKTIQDKCLYSNQELRILNLSESQITSLPLLRDLKKLTHLLLRDCTNLERLRKITALSSLQILDLSGSTNFKEFVDPSFEKLASLKVLDVSQTAVDKLPLDIGSLHQLCVRDCPQLKELPLTESVKGLLILDLSGSCYLEDIPESFFSHPTSIGVLNLSQTNIKRLPALSDLRNLRHLSLSQCISLETLGELKSTTKLEILDLSGCKALKEVQGRSLENMHRLQKLDLSGTNITCLPSLSSNLHHLILKGCSNLKELPPLNHLSRLEELNLSGVSSTKKVAPDLEHMVNLQILDLSDTQLEKLFSLLKLKNLKYLSLRDCPSLSEVPGLEALTKLEVLDLSGTGIKDLPSLENFGNLHRLLLKGCLSLEKFKDLKMHEVLKATIEELPYEISKVTCLEQLELPIFRVGELDSEKDKLPSEDQSQLPWSISNWPKEPAFDNKLIITVNSIDFLQFLKDNPSFWNASFTQFHFFVHPTEAYGRYGDKNFYRNELLLRDLYFNTRQLSAPMGRERSLEIRGFISFPKCLGLILAHAECIILVDDPFLTCLSDVGTDNIKKMNACWIERCNEMKDLFHTEKVEDAARSGGSTNTGLPEQDVGDLRIGENLEVLCVTHAASLRSICKGDMQSSSLRNLKCLLLEHCPQISALAASPEQLGNLETLQLRFCDKLVTLFEQELAAFPKLHTLKLWALPEFKNVRCVLPALQTLEIGECPMLINVFSSPHVLVNLRNLQIKFCDAMETVFGCGNLTLPNLEMLCLWNLPELRSIGADWPSSSKEVVRECPKLSLRKRN
ncbi:putative disease resistance protein At4g19050 [Coffea arabica]|uniref:Disease resistance protein At4g19050 n=1 Tax=Coffea arabica TaxID=13443 RepID=A0A6P6W8K4_COFAR